MGNCSKGYGFQRGAYNLARLGVSNLDEVIWCRREVFTRQQAPRHATVTEMFLFGPQVTRRCRGEVLETMVMPPRLSLLRGGPQQTISRMGRTDREGIACAYRRLNGRSLEHPPLSSPEYGYGQATAPCL